MQVCKCILISLEPCIFSKISEYITMMDAYPLGSKDFILCIINLSIECTDVCHHYLSNLIAMWNAIQKNGYNFGRETRMDMWYITLEWVYVQLLSRNVSNVVCQRWWKEDSNVCLNCVLMLLIHITFWHANISFSCYYSFTFNFDFFTT